MVTYLLKKSYQIKDLKQIEFQDLWGDHGTSRGLGDVYKRQGFQHILFCEGAKIVEQRKIYHGFQSNIKVINSKSLFKKGTIFKVGRYHSLKLKEPFKSNNFEITMRCLNSKVAMAFENQKEKIYGFQFHPESFLTINGNVLIKKILSN